MAKMLNKTELHQKTQWIIDNDINYRICSKCENSRDLGYKCVCNLREKRSLGCKFVPSKEYYFDIFILIKKRYGKQYLQEVAKEAMLSKAGVLIDRGLRIEEINNIIDSIINTIE